MSKLSELWNAILAEIEKDKEITALAFDLWIRTLEPLCIFTNRLILVAATEANRNLADKRYHLTIVKATNKVFPSLAEIEIITSDQIDAFKDYIDAPVSDDVLNLDNIEDGRSSSQFITRYNFDTFVVGKSNEFVAAAARAVADNPGSKYNPLFIYGGVGLGKTHLMHAIGNYLKRTKSKLKCLYVSSEKFTNELIEALMGNNRQDVMKLFRKKYRDVDVLMIDDIQFIAKTESTQEELFHTFNDLYFAGKQIVISSDRPPKEIAPLEERLRTRFEGGLIADIKPPDLETRMAILSSKALQEKQNISRQVLEIIALKCQTNIREMEGLLTKVLSYASLVNKSPNDLEVINIALKDYADDKKEIITIDSIVDAVVDYYKVDISSLVGKKKNKEIVEPRMVCMYLICEFLTVPLVAIGQYFGGRDHTTVIHARDKISTLLLTDTRTACAVKDVKDMIMRK